MLLLLSCSLRRRRRRRQVDDRNSQSSLSNYWDSKQEKEKRLGTRQAGRQAGRLHAVKITSNTYVHT